MGKCSFSVMPIRIFCHDSAVIRSRGHNNNAVPNPSSETARTIASHFSFRFMGSALPAKPITQAIEDARICPSPSVKVFPANLVVSVQCNRDASPSASPYFDAVQIETLVFRLLQEWIFFFEKRPPQLLFHLIFKRCPKKADLFPYTTLFRSFLRHANSDLLPRFGGD